MEHSPGPLAQRTAQWRLLQQDLAAGEQVTLPVISGSMMPLIPAGARITVQGLGPAEIPEVGEVVVFRDRDRLVAHRLLFFCPLPSPGWYLQRGDGASPAGVVGRARICGRVVAVSRPGDRDLDLTPAAARHQGRRAARRSLWRWCRGGFLLARRKDPA
ncbi:MAG: S26 family signal peptidase [Candidatus Krumholzibacteriia bacterium]